MSSSPSSMTTSGELMTAAEIKRGHVYRAKHPRKRYTLGLGDHFTDREVVYVDERRVQYDGPHIKLGQHFPTVSMDEFLAWVGKDVTEQERNRKGSYFEKGEQES